MSGERIERPRGPRSEGIDLDPIDLSAKSRIRSRDSMGALRPGQAEVDAAYARGYAQGLEEAQADSLDQLRTILAAMVEAKFGPLAEEHLEWIEQAESKQLVGAITACQNAQSLHAIFTH